MTITRATSDANPGFVNMIGANTGYECNYGPSSDANPGYVNMTLDMMFVGSATKQSSGDYICEYM